LELLTSKPTDQIRWAFSESPAWGKKNRSDGTRRSDSKASGNVCLADFGAEESAVVFDTNLSAAQKISHGCDRFLGVFRAGTDREDQVTERKLRTGLFEDLAVLFHMNYLPNETATPVPAFKNAV
jgi:hypothetical protein